MKKISEIKNKEQKVAGLITILSLIGSLLVGCGDSFGSKEEIAQIQKHAMEEYTTKIADIEVDESVKIIGLGEATHGNVELQNLKKDVFEALLENNGCRIFAIEGDFGGGLKVNEYIHGGEGTAREATAEIGFALYRTKEMENLIQWMRDYNAKTSEQEQISFYGFDMQRYDNSKEVLFKYLETVGNESRESYKEGLKNLSDETVYEQDENLIKEAQTVAEQLQKELISQRDAYIAASDTKSYEIACECIHAIIENATLQLSSDYGNLRDGYMKERINWIYALEGNQQIFITGHDGHIEKSGAVKSYVSMGTQLGKEYGKDYYAIGTDFIRGDVNVVNSAGERNNLSIENRNAITNLFENQEGNVFYLDFAKAENIPELKRMITHKQSMINIGSTLDSFQTKIKPFYTLNMIPNKAYDAIIIIRQVTPTAPWEME